MSNPWQQVFESHREQIEESYVAEKYGQHKSDESQETQALYDLRNKMKNMGKDAVVAYLKRSKMSPERKARLAKSLGISIAEEYIQEKVRNPYAIGMAAAMKATGDKPPLEKSTIKKAHKIAKKVEEELEYIEEEAKILVRVTKEDGSVFQKKIPQSQLADYRKRYKTVVVVGGSEQSQSNTNAKNEEYVGEAKKTHRWWDDDGDDIGYEKGEVSGKFKKKKKTRKEEYSDWRSEFPELAEATKAQKSVEGKAHSSYESEEGEKKKRKKKSAKSECDCSHEMKESAEILAQELGGELVDITENIGKALGAALKTATKVVPKLKLGTEPAGKLATRTTSTAIVKAKPQTTAIVKAKPQTTAITKPQTKTTAITKTDTKTGQLVKVKPETTALTRTQTGQLVKLDPKTGAITQVVPQTTAITKSGTGGVPPKGPDVPSGPGGGKPNFPSDGPIKPSLPLGLPKIRFKPYLRDPVADTSTLKL
ncbi:hypothetical protein [Synechococcus phage DSL-LC03]|nr:hypothetical protein [Synechococcus phage DSL-LC03]